MLTFRISLVALAMMTAAAQAQSVPRYDVETYCKRVADSIGGSSQIEKTCIEQEQDAYNGLKSNWSTLPSRAAEYCDTVASSIGGSYQIMATCIDQETNAAAKKPGFQY